MTTDSLDEYLKETRYCDIHSQEIDDFYRAIGSRDTNEIANLIFNFVRDSVKYRFDYPWVKASETLRKKTGNCFNKANLQIALLRRAGIPAGYGVYLVHKEILKPILPPDIYLLVNQPTVHVFAKLFIHNRWVNLDATVDFELFQCFYNNSSIWSHTHWDGLSDISLDKSFVVEDQGVYANIDLYLSQPPKFWTDNLIQKANCFIEQTIKKMKKEQNDGKSHK
ncbi:MAG TPA: transglutaminase family protein [bacterium]|nr:transglutaminase family protein [bacterium]HOL36123.1 transglutaminase family protein [bacterium]HPP09331.1 transglutaminase family protein [bacterium]